MSWYLFLAPLEGQNIIWIFSDLGVSTLQKSIFPELVAFALNWGILQTRMDQRWDYIKINFDYFQIKKKRMLQTVRAEKLDKKIRVICLVSMFLTWVMACKLSKKMHFLQFCADLSKKYKSVEAIHIYVSEKVSLHSFRKCYDL